MEVSLRVNKRRVKKPIVLDHYWYDPETRQQLHGRGGRMIFVYDHQRKKRVPRIIDETEWTFEDSYEDIKNWIQNSNVNIIDDVPGHYVNIDVDIEEWPDIEAELYRNKFHYDYDEQDTWARESHTKRGNKIWQNSESKWQIHLPP